jgi:hypothetical protein
MTLLEKWFVQFVKQRIEIKKANVLHFIRLVCCHRSVCGYVVDNYMEIWETCFSSF